MAKEKRDWLVHEGQVELREDSDGNQHIVGRAIAYDSESNAIYGEFVEVIKRGALEGADKSRVVARAGHDDQNLLGTTMGGTLTLEEREDGLYYDILVPDTTAGRDYAEYIRRGDIQGSSFAFIPDYRDGGVTWVDRSDEKKLPIREINKIKGLYDVSPVINPAYPASSVGLRSADEMMKEFKEFMEERNGPTEDDLEQERQLKANSDSLKSIHKYLKTKYQ